MKLRSRSLLFAAGAAALGLLGCSDSRQAAVAAGSAVRSGVPRQVDGEPVGEGPLTSTQADLLDLGFRAALALPLEPHLKDRARAQEDVVVACLVLDQPLRAREYVDRIPNWRRGTGYADLSFYWAERGDEQRAEEYLALAEREAREAEQRQDQQWRRDRILAKMARTMVWLGRGDEVVPIEAALVEAEAGIVWGARASLLASEDFEARIQAIDHHLKSGSFDRMRGALETCAKLYERFYDEEDYRAQAKERIDLYSPKLPPLVHATALHQLAEAALEHGDEENALALLDQARKILGDASGNAEYIVPVLARLAPLRFRAGDEGGARSYLEDALTAYDAKRDAIIDMFRAAVLRPVAEAYQAIGDPAMALAVYSTAVEEGFENHNSRPRAVDLAATCASMATCGFEPDERLWVRMRDIHAALDAPQ